MNDTLLLIIFMAVALTGSASVGYYYGQIDGRKLGRSVGIRIGERRAREQVSK